MLIAAVRSLLAYVAVSLYVLVTAPVGMILAMTFGWRDVLYIFGHGGDQMGLSLAFHMGFAAVGVALPLFMVIADVMYLRTRDEDYLRISKRMAKGTAILFAVGAAPARALAGGAVAACMAATKVRYFATSDEAADAAAALVTTGDLVLVKVSRGVKTDRVVDRLKVEQG